MKKPSQKDRIVKHLLQHGEVRRNYFVNLPYDKILRLGAITDELENEGWEFDAGYTERREDYVYKIKRSPLKKIIYTIPDGRQIITYK